MKKTIIFLLLATLFVIPVFSKGTVGIGASHQFVFVKGQKGIVSQGIVAEVTGQNTFPSFGIEYSVYKPFMFGRLSDNRIYGGSIKALYAADISEKFGLSFALGLFDSVNLGTVTVNEIGAAGKISFSYKPLDALQISLNAGYRTPLLLIYNDTAKMTVFKEHVLEYGIAVSYVY